jgi:glycosyltransferase involved in cell wall biosynthesis
MILEALAADYALYLLMIPVVGVPTPSEMDIDPVVARWCTDLAVLPVRDKVDTLFHLISRVQDPQERLAAYLAYPKPALCRFATPGAVRDAARMFHGIHFREVHVFRLYMAPFAEPYLNTEAEHRPTCRLDLDDYESRTRQRLATLYRAAGNWMSAAVEQSEAVKYTAMERQYIPRFSRTYVGSYQDRVELASQYKDANLGVLPNGVRIPSESTGGSRDGPFTFLFVGNLGYYPNEDALLFFCAEVLPHLRALASQRFCLRIIGTHPSRRLLALSAYREVTVIGGVPDVAVHYGAADAVVVPLRAGGGTRIKVLEAFSYRRPVVSTSLGAEGIDVRHGVHLLIGDTPVDLARQSMRLMESPALRRELVEHALAFVKVNHSLERVRELLR